MKVYKIRRKADGMFSTGGVFPDWNKNGKTWNTIGHIKNHLNMFNHVYSYENGKSCYIDITAKHYSGCEIVEYELSIAEVSVKDVV